MSRRPERAAVLEAVRPYLLRAETQPHLAITYPALAAETGFDRRTIKKWAETEVEAARARQARAGRSARAREEEAYASRLQELRDEISDLKKKNEALLGRMILMEGNARRLGIDPSDFYKPLTKPDRTVSRAGQGRGRKKR